MARPRCKLICVGSELLRGKLNTHAAYLSRRLPEIGLALDAEETLPDDEALLATQIESALKSFSVVIVTGGLGPTFDDLSREAAATASGHPLLFSKALAQELRQKFRHARIDMPETNLRQAQLLKGATPIPNRVGTAPGQWLEMGGEQRLVLLPGPPRELYPMLDSFVFPRLRKAFRQPERTCARFHFVGVPESLVDEKVRLLIDRYKSTFQLQLDFTILAHLALVDFEVYCTGGSANDRKKLMQTISKDLKILFPQELYGLDDEATLERVVASTLVRKRWTIAVAESCTGGMLGMKLTQQPGSSRYFLGGAITYTGKLKHQLLGVPEKTLKQFGEVSEETAKAMANGVRVRLGSSIGVGITGIAGPGGGSKTKPVGMVCIGVSTAQATFARTFQFRGDRDVIRERATIAALDLVRGAL